MRLIILAAGQGTRLRPLTDTRPKCLVELNGLSLLDWQVQTARKVGIEDIIIVGGYMAEQLARPGVKVILNPEFATTNMVYTLFCVESEFGDGFVLSYGDIAYSHHVLQRLLNHTAQISVVVDRLWRDYWELRFEDPLKDAESLRIDADGNIQSIGQIENQIDRIEAQYIGLMAFRNSGVDVLRQTYDVARQADRAGEIPFNSGRSLRQLFMTDLLQGMINMGYPVKPVPVDGEWVEIDSLHDLDLAEQLIASGRFA